MDGQARKKLFSEVPVISGSRLCLKPLGPEHTGALQELVQSDIVYRYLPTFLYERKYADISYVIRHLYDECFRESIILGIFEGEAFCGLAEMYGYREPIHKVSVGYRLLERCWGKGIASEALRMIVDYLYNETETEIITASTMVENLASARVLTKNGFSLVVHAVDEDWGYDRPTVADKWIR
ncbi:MAG: GNAT family N-acetyltransferase [Firmicutes bacterium]|nr:GNAT family N-acetyltransferase [Bacillota bacterium]